MKTVEVTYRYRAEEILVRERPADADAAQDRLDEGNRGFASLFNALGNEEGPARRVIQVDPYDLGLLEGAGHRQPKQRPYAAVLGCSDARVPIELIFNEGPNDLFVVRVAGNALGPDTLASLKYAVDHLGESLKLVVVLGHSGCGAVSAAVDIFLNPANYLTLASRHMLRSLLDRQLIVVHASATRLAAEFGPDVSSRPGYRQALIEAAVVTNAAFGAYSVQQELAHVGASGMRAVFGVYVLSDREVWAPRCGSRHCAGLAPPPRGDDEFAELAGAVIRSDRIVALLG